MKADGASDRYSDRAARASGLAAIRDYPPPEALIGPWSHGKPSRSTASRARSSSAYGLTTDPFSCQ